MDAQTKTADAANFKWRAIGLLLLVWCFACSIPTLRTRVIPEGIAVDPEQLIEKLNMLQPGMPVKLLRSWRFNPKPRLSEKS